MIAIRPPGLGLRRRSCLFIAPLLALTGLSLPAWSADGPGASPPPPPLPVIAALVRLQPFSDPLEALGTLKARESVALTANVTETVSVVLFDDGQRVKAGDILVEMTSAEEHALIEEAQARVGEAKRQFDRVKSLAGQRSAAESLVDERRRELETAEAARGAIESRLADRLIKAPFGGVLGLRNISVGALVEPGDLITTLDDISTMKLDFTVPSIFLDDLRPGLAVKARAREFGDLSFTGQVSGVDSRIDPVTRSIQVRALIPNPEGRLKPGLLMQVELTRNPREALTVPEAALIQQGPDHFVVRVTPEDTAERVKVSIGARRPGEVEILTGLAVGEQVLTHGNDKVRPGQALKVRVDDGSRPIKDLLGAAGTKTP